MTTTMGHALTRRQAVCTMLLAKGLHAAQRTPRQGQEVRRIAAPEATQAVAVDAVHFYAIGNHAIAKYDKRTGKRISGWECEPGKPLIHLNSGVVHDGALYCAHSNYPGVPMVSSIEVWDARTLRHMASHSFGIFAGSATWIDLYGGRRFVTFAHYGNRAAEPGRDPRWTTLVEFDNDWRQLGAWVYPEQVVAKLGQYSISGGVFTPEGSMYCTGHDNAEIYVLRFPDGGSSLVLEETFAVPVHGQGIALDASAPGTLYGIDRAKGEVVVMRLANP